MFKVLKPDIFISIIISNNITHAKYSNSRQNLSFGVKGQKTESNAFFCNTYRDNISPPVSSPMLDFNIGLYGGKSKDRAIRSHRHNAKENFNNCKKFSIIISNIKSVISISVHICFFSRQYLVSLVTHRLAIPTKAELT